MRRVTSVRALLGAALGVSLAVAPCSSPSAQADDDLGPTDHVGLVQAGNWLALQVDRGAVRTSTGAPDWRLTLAAVQALRISGGHDEEVGAIERNLWSSGDGYLELDYVRDGDRITGHAADATADVLAYQQSLSPAPRLVGTVDVRQRLESLVVPSGPSAGRISDASLRDGVADPVDTSTTAGQAAAAFGLSRSGSGAAGAVLSFLLRQQCSNGGFRPSFTTDEQAADQSCADPATADVATTAGAVHQLDQIFPSTPTIMSAKTRAKEYLTATQNADGSWGSSDSDRSPLARNTGLALFTQGDSESSRRGAAWLRSQQVTVYNLCDALGSGERGSLAPSPQALAVGQVSGLTSGARPQWLLATAAATAPLARLTADSTPAAPVITAPSGFVQGGAPLVLTITGVDAQDRLCVQGTGTAVKLDGAEPARATVTVAPGTSTRGFTVRTPSGASSTTSVKALGTKRLTLSRSASTVKRGRYLGITVKGLAAGEATKVTYAGRTVGSGTARANGTFYARFAVGSTVTTRTVRGYGEFPDARRGSTTFRVVR